MAGYSGCMRLQPAHSFAHRSQSPMLRHVFCQRSAPVGQPVLHLQHPHLLCTHSSRLQCRAAAGLDLSIQDSLYQLSQYLDGLVQAQLSGVTPVTFSVVFIAGLGTSLSPCTLSVLPLTIGYIGGYAAPDPQKVQQQPQQPEQQRQVERLNTPASSSSSDTPPLSSPSSSSGSSSSSSTSTAPKPTAAAGATASATATSDSSIPTPTPTTTTTTTTSSSSSSTSTTTTTTGSRSATSSSSKLSVQAVCFSLGLASTLAALGVASSLLGQAYGTALGDGLPLLVGGVAVAMGLNLLEVLPLQLPSLDVDVRSWGLPAPLAAYLAGATFAVAASPCSTPVLASLLGWVTTTRDPVTGGALLLCYSCGYVAPLLAAASATGAVRQVVGLRQYSTWVTPASGVLLLAGGTYTLLNRLLPAL